MDQDQMIMDTSDPPKPTNPTRDDADGLPIHKGSVLMHIEDGERGVVTDIAQAGDNTMLPLLSHGDLVIAGGPGNARITNRYTKWRHIPRAEQTYQERLTSWLHTKMDFYLAGLTYSDNLSKDALTAIDGIMALLPSDAVDVHYGPWPDSIEGALAILVEHLTAVRTQ